MISRYFDPFDQLENSSLFILGPRSTGKSSMAKKFCRKHRDKIDYINLSGSRIYLRLKSDPFLLSSLVDKDLIAIDEIQRIPELLNEVHRMIEDKNKRFLLIGNYNQKLKWKKIDLLDNHSTTAELFPLTWFELSKNNRFDLDKYLHFGGLPGAYLEENGDDYLYNYIDIYLREEIYAEGLVSNLPHFIRFLEYAACDSTQAVDYNGIAEKSLLSSKEVKNYYKVLKETFMGFEVLPWVGLQKKKTNMPPKFYFFDLGIVRTLQANHRAESENSFLEPSFNQFIACELRSYLSYKKIPLFLQYWKSKLQRNVDFIVGDEMAIVVKTDEEIDESHHRELLEIQQKNQWKYLFVISNDFKEVQFKNGIGHLHWQNFLDLLWKDSFFAINK
ncbi:MAG: AAA family ATPase [Bacteriovoracales bacterium]|nr:AAA family ATPase [Bacteriovoracales bacterium]